MEGMRRGWGGQPGLGQAGSRAPSQPEQEALGNAEAGPWGLERVPSSLRLPSCGGRAGWGGEILGASPGLPEEELGEGKVAGRVLHPLSTWPLGLVSPARSPLFNPETRSRKDLEIIWSNLLTYSENSSQSSGTGGDLPKAPQNASC